MGHTQKMRHPEMTIWEKDSEESASNDIYSCDNFCDKDKKQLKDREEF